jgi:hypothetical protein
MAKIQSPLLGYNNNVRHKNRVFHIQTEDSGVKHPHVITHLFMDGGRILKSVKRSYAEHVGSDNMSDTVRQMMKEQHKAMFIALRDGEYDPLLDGGVSPSPTIPQPLVAPKAEESGRREVREVPSAREAREKADTTAAMASVTETSREASPTGAVPPGIDMQALEAASLNTGERAALLSSPPNDLPPPPKNLFQKELTGNIGYRSTHVEDEDSRNGSSPPKRPASTPPLQRPRVQSQPAPDPKRAGLARTQPSVAPAAPLRPSIAPPGVTEPPPTQKEDPKSRRYAPARPAAIFGQSQTPSSSIFGDELVGDKSLDEVILSYLVDDLSPPKKK